MTSLPLTIIRPRTLCLFPVSISVTLPALITDIPPAPSAPSFGTLVRRRHKFVTYPQSHLRSFSRYFHVSVQFGAPPFPRLHSSPLVAH